jgi:hypothetical protein
VAKYLDEADRDGLLVLAVMSSNAIDSFRNVLEDEVQEDFVLLRGEREAITVSRTSSDGKPTSLSREASTHLVTTRIEVVLQLDDVLMLQAEHNLKLTILKSKNEIFSSRKGLAR